MSLTSNRCLFVCESASLSPLQKPAQIILIQITQNRSINYGHGTSNSQQNIHTPSSSSTSAKIEEGEQPNRAASLLRDKNNRSLLLSKMTNKTIQYS